MYSSWNLFHSHVVYGRMFWWSYSGLKSFIPRCCQSVRPLRDKSLWSENFHPKQIRNKTQLLQGNRIRTQQEKNRSERTPEVTSCKSFRVITTDSKVCSCHWRSGMVSNFWGWKEWDIGINQWWNPFIFNIRNQRFGGHIMSGNVHVWHFTLFKPVNR